MANLPIILFALVLSIYVVIGYFIWYHLDKFGIGHSPKIVLVIFLGGSAALIALSLFYFFNVAWQNLIHL